MLGPKHFITAQKIDDHDNDVDDGGNSHNSDYFAAAGNKKKKFSEQ